MSLPSLLAICPVADEISISKCWIDGQTDGRINQPTSLSFGLTACGAIREIRGHERTMRGRHTVGAILECAVIEILIGRGFVGLLLCLFLINGAN